jgi:ribonuclease H / adenosylcobalamin/alpha-ribazole phosphatase
VPPTRILLVRHALCDHVGSVLAGRTPGIPLNDEGRAQAGRLARMLADVSIAAVGTSPLQRARETAAVIAAKRDLPVIEHAGLGEVDFGEWTGRSFVELADDPLWQQFNTLRSATRPPGGELFGEVQARAVGAVVELAAQHAGSTVALVSHADVIRAILVHVLGMPPDHLLRLEVAPASVTTVVLGGGPPLLLELNRTC